MHDVDRRAGHLGEADRPVRAFGLGNLWARERVIDGGGVALRESLLHEDIDGDAVLGVHADEPPDFAGALHGAEDLPIVDQEDPGIGHEHLEGRDSLVDDLPHLRDGVVVHVGQDHVECIVDGRFALGLRVPGIEAFAQRVSLRLDGKVDDARCPSVRRGTRPRFEVVRR